MNIAADEKQTSPYPPIYVSVVGRRINEIRVAAGKDRGELFRDLIEFHNEMQEDAILGYDATEDDVVEAIHENLDDFVRIFEC